MLKSAAFAKHLAVITLESDVLDLDPIPRWVLYKKNIKRAALNVRDELLLADHRSHYAEEQLHMTIARMAWRQDVDLASRLLPLHKTVRDCITIADGAVRLVAPLAFAAKVRSLRLQHIKRAKEELSKAPANAPPTFVKGSAEGLDRLAKMWSPFDRRVEFNGIRKMVDGIEVFSEDSSSRSAWLAEHWAPVFAHKDIDSEAADQILKGWATPVLLDSVPPPDRSTMVNVIRRAKHSAAGLDGIPYAGWRAHPDISALVLYPLLELMLGGTCLPEVAHDSLFVFVAKVDPALSNGFIQAGETRPLALKKSDVKILSATISAAVRPILNVSTHWRQRGFIPKRNFIVNVLDADSKSRCFSAEYRPSCPFVPTRVPVLTAWDFAAAFPSLSQCWMILSLEARGAPSSLILFIRSLYECNRTFGFRDGLIAWLFDVLSGILQGDPASGWLYAVTCDPFTRMIEDASQPQPDPPPSSAASAATSGACADDNFAVVRQAAQLVPIAGCFTLIERAAALALKPTKCVIVSAVKLSASELASFVEWKNQAIPLWKKCYGRAMQIALDSGLALLLETAPGSNPLRNGPLAPRLSLPPLAMWPSSLTPHRRCSTTRKGFCNASSTWQTIRSVCRSCGLGGWLAAQVSPP